MTQLFLPLVASVLGTWVLAPAARRIRPHHGSWLAASVILSVFVTVVVTAWAVVLAVLAHDPAVHGVLGWCPHLLGLDHTKLVYRHQGRPERLTLNEGEPYTKLIG